MVLKMNIKENKVSIKMKDKENKVSIKMKDKESWILRQKELLELERLAEIESSKTEVGEISLKQLEAKGIAISRLRITERATGLFGRPTITLSRNSQQGVLPQLPSHTFSSGDIVGIWENAGSAKGEGQLASGVVSKLTATSIQIALDEDSPALENLGDDDLIRIHKLANDVTYKRIKRGLDEIGNNLQACSYHLTEVLFKEADPYDPVPQVPLKLLTKNGLLDQFNKQLDESQVDAVKFALMQKDLAVVHGPPGTGKTTTLVEIIIQHVKFGCKVLAVAPSNLAVDNLVEKLVESKVKVVRVGHPARATLKAQQRSLDALIQNSDEYELIQDIHKDIKNSVAGLGKTKEKGKKFRLKEDIKNFRKELRNREMRLSKDILSRNDVILTTLTSAGNSGPLKLLPRDHFSLTVIDECSQGLECACYLALMKSPKLLIAGDHQQLPPTIISTEAAKEGLLVSLMERVIDMYSSRVTKMLKTQYRMNSCIMDWASEALYEGQLKAHDSVSSHLLSQLKGVDANEDTENAMILIDTAGCNFEEVSGDDLSKGNEGEAAIVAEQVKRLIGSGVGETQVAVISPYNLQVEMIRTLLREIHPHVEVRSVDGFQGREKECILISLVRSNKQGEIGFLAEDRRLNVAVTRARRQLTLICDTDTVCRHNFIKSLVDHISANGVVKSGHEFESELEFQPKTTNYKAPEPIKPSKQRKEKKVNQNQNKEKENELRRKEYETKISDFVNSEKLILEFPKNLNSFERFLIHEIASKHGLFHSSKGEEKERFIYLNKEDEKLESSSVDTSKTDDGAVKPCDDKFELKIKSNESISSVIKDSNKEIESPENEDIALGNDSNINKLVDEKSDDLPAVRKKTKSSKKQKQSKPKLKLEENLPKNSIKEDSKLSLKEDSSTAKKEEVLRTCKLCQKEVGVRNFDLHEMRCEKLKREAEIKEEIKKRQTEIKGVKKKDKKGTEEIDDFELMAKYAKENNTCAFPRCKNPSIILLQLCNFCRNNFCLKHHQAEIHGCGEEVRKYSRTVLLKSVQNGVLTPGSRVPSKKPDPAIRVHLERKLNKKLGDLGDQRKFKKNDK